MVVVVVVVVVTSQWIKSKTLSMVGVASIVRASLISACHGQWRFGSGSETETRAAQGEPDPIPNLHRFPLPVL